MDSVLVSSERRTVKVTYSSKKRRSSGKGDAVEESEASETEVEPTSASRDNGKTIARRNLKDTLNLPGPEPRAKGPGSKKNVMDKNSSSPHTPRISGTSMKPASKLSSKMSRSSAQRLTTPESDGMPPPPASDISDKEGSSRPARTTETERRAYLESHPDVAELEPHRVRCRCCNKWLKLSTTQNYALAPWRLHKKACTSEKPCTKKSRRNKELGSAPVASGAEDDDASSIAPSISASEATGVSTAGRQRSSAERQRLLEEDELSGEVRPDSVFCSTCGKWIKLSNRTAYQLKNWTTHAVRVHGRTEGSSTLDRVVGAPSSRVREAERKLQLVNDAQAREFSASRVTCKVCAAEVALSETVAYQLDNWLAHKSACPALTPSQSTARPDNESLKSVLESASVASNVSLSPRKRSVACGTPSTTSTDVTCIAADGATDSALANGFSAVGQKRRRENDDAEEGGSEPVRARTTSYVVTDEKPSGSWGWLKLPWETFKRGFAEGLGMARGEELNNDG